MKQDEMSGTRSTHGEMIYMHTKFELEYLKISLG